MENNKHITGKKDWIFTISFDVNRSEVPEPTGVNM